MTPTEAAALLTIAAAFDNRKPNEEAATAWAAALNGLPFDDCRDAVLEYYREEREWLMPVEIVKRVRKKHHERIEAGLKGIQPPASVDAIEDHDEHDRAYRAWLQETRERLARGLPVERELHVVAAVEPGEHKAYLEDLNKAIDESGRGMATKGESP
jgi:hypothetical protein